MTHLPIAAFGLILPFSSLVEVIRTTPCEKSLNFNVCKSILTLFFVVQVGSGFSICVLLNTSKNLM